MIPNLVTVMDKPALALEKTLIDATSVVERWFRMAWQDYTPPFYCSVDLRNAGFKLAPVDTNLFPGGFNNLAADMLPLAVQAAMSAIEKYCPEAKNLLLIPENHTRNTHYLASVSRLMEILRQTGLDIRLGTLSNQVTQPTPMTMPDGTTVVLEPVKRINNGRRVGLDDFNPCTILLNNDLSAGTPEILQDVYEQNLFPPLHAGWTVRRKSNHFAAYDDVVRRFSRTVGIDPWLVNPYFAHCRDINFEEKSGGECLAEQVNAVLGRIRRKYREYSIRKKPFAIIKADAGTYGMGIMTVSDAKEVLNLNRRQRNKMAVIKDGQAVREVLVQEGVHSLERVNDAVAEPVVYMIDRYVVGGFYRVNANRDIDENLNAPGAEFVPLPFSQQHTLPDVSAAPGTSEPNRYYMYGVIARLALLAASVELEKTDPDMQ